MRTSLKARHTVRYGELARLLLAHRGAVTSRAERSAQHADAQRLAAELEAMGPTYVKLGQLLSTRADLLPPAYLDALARLQDHVEPLEPGVAERVLHEELGARAAAAIASIDPSPLASASLGQVHRAWLRDGRAVAVKVQRPGVQAQVDEDMAVVAELAAFLDDHSALASRLGFVAIAEELRRTLLDELDYRKEAANLHRLADELGRYRRHLVVPAPVDEATGERVLTMELVRGRNVAALGAIELSRHDGAALATALFEAYLDQVVVHGFFHADPHPGNVMLTDDGRLGLVDLGQVARVAPEVREELLRLLVALGELSGRRVADALERLGEPLEGYDADQLTRQITALLARTEGTRLERLEAGTLVGELTRIAGGCRLRPPAELAVLGKTLLDLDDVARRLDPSFEPEAAIRRHLGALLEHRMREGASPRHLLGAALEGAEFAEHLPRRLNKVLDALAEGRFNIQVDGLDEAELMRGIQKLANRGAAGVVVAALLLAAGLFAGAHAGPAWWGFSSISTVMLGIAAAVGAWLAVSMRRSDLPQRRRER